MQIPVYNKNHVIVSVEEFKPNLNLHQVPSYLNESCNMGLVRISKGPYKNCLAVLYEHPFYPSCNRGEIISDNEAFEICQNRGKVHLIDQYKIQWNLGIIGVGDES